MRIFYDFFYIYVDSFLIFKIHKKSVAFIFSHRFFDYSPSFPTFSRMGRVLLRPQRAFFNVFRRERSATVPLPVCTRPAHCLWVESEKCVFKRIKSSEKRAKTALKI